ncbi:hypothetical protein O181_043098 [Austropuccinia psidii MF-1]|uniref:Uncharacterized protein n=1 Tax=Austropuccinia psidii MF-1 TaxID=1389203 RepID=A0A9Q3DME7_9BASI|nr:hypothetical protein [Austropuccinia psidii MF-1]
MIHPLDPPSLVPSPEIPTASSPHSNDEAWQEFTDFPPTLMIPPAMVHKSINQIFLEDCQLLHMIPFVDMAHQNDMHWEFQEEQNSLLGQALEPYPKQNITPIVPRFLKKKSHYFLFLPFVIHSFKLSICIQ